MGIPFLSNAVPAEPKTTTNTSGSHNIKLSTNANYKVNASNEATTIRLDEAGSVVGQAGTIIITNPASVGSLSFSINVAGTAGDIKTPGGSSITFNTTANNVHLISYYVNASDQVLINYIGMFA
tara:strand:+ start:794 stop:1165 length:372 start_codon:yes stop_codon:yes gene_type:complete